MQIKHGRCYSLEASCEILNYIFVTRWGSSPIISLECAMELKSFVLQRI